MRKDSKKACQFRAVRCCTLSQSGCRIFWSSHLVAHENTHDYTRTRENMATANAYLKWRTNINYNAKRVLRVITGGGWC